MIPRFAMTLEEYARCWKKLADSIQPMIRDKMERDVPQFEEYIREQLYSGVDGDESPLIPGYTEDPYFKKTYGEHWKKNAERYKNWKTKIQKPKPSYLGFSARGNNTPNLIIRGDFYSSITAIPISNGIRIASYGVSFGSDIEKKYGYKIFKVSSKARRHYVTYRLMPSIEKFIRRCEL